jgi:hypothetical protein
MPLGIGSQLDSISGPGEFAWMYTSSEPSALYFSGMPEPI